MTTCKHGLETTFACGGEGAEAQLPIIPLQLACTHGQPIVCSCRKCTDAIESFLRAPTLCRHQQPAHACGQCPLLVRDVVTDSATVYELRQKIAALVIEVGEWRHRFEKTAEREMRAESKARYEEERATELWKRNVELADTCGDLKHEIVGLEAENARIRRGHRASELYSENVKRLVVDERMRQGKR